MDKSFKLKPLKRCLVKLGGRGGKGELRHAQAYYFSWFQVIVLNWPWYQREKHVEANVEDNIEHETFHHVLGHRISSEVSDQFDNLPYMRSVLEGLHPMRLTVAQFSNSQKSQHSNE
jgi:hypothetical protein